MHLWHYCRDEVVPGYIDRAATRCGISTGHYHCAHCKMIAFQGDTGLFYLAYHDRSRGVREYEQIPIDCPCPMPRMYEPYVSPRVRRLPFKSSQRWSLVMVCTKESSADAWLYSIGEAMGSDVVEYDKIGGSKAVWKRFSDMYLVFARVKRAHVVPLIRRCLRDADSGARVYRLGKCKKLLL